MKECILYQRYCIQFTHHYSLHVRTLFQRPTPHIYFACSDIRFVVGEERQAIYAHKCLLAARCEVFKAMFAVQKNETESSGTPLVLSDIKPSIFLAVLEFIYTNCSSLSTDMVIDVLAASIEYGLDGLTKVISMYNTHVCVCTCMYVVKPHVPSFSVFSCVFVS